MVRSQTFKLGLALVIAAVVVASVAVTMSVRATAPDAPTIPTWPSFTMVYETDGVTYSVGSSLAETTREVRQLDYQSRTRWTDTVLEAPTIITSVGSSSRVGSYSQLNGDSYTESDSSDEQTYVDTVEENTTRLVGSMPPPFPIEGSGVALESITTNAKVCFRDSCTGNAPGLLYRKANGSEFVFADDTRGIPLRVNNTFIVREIRIKDAQQPVAR